METTKTSSEVQDPIITKESTTIQSAVIAPAAQDTADFICIVDNTTLKNSKPRNSVTIKREINKTSSEKIDIKHTVVVQCRSGINLIYGL